MQTAESSTAAPAEPFQKPIPEEFFRRLDTNAETRLDALPLDEYLTPVSRFFVRSHASAPDIDPATWRLSVEGPAVERPFSIGYQELLDLPSTTYIRYLECAGNGRAFYASLLDRPADGTPWLLGACGIAEWTGVPLKALLERAGLKDSAFEVMPVGLDAPGVRRPMPIARALDPETILAYRMNGQPLVPDHGFPARVVVPGWVGISSIKWVGALVVTETHTSVEWNTARYVMVGPGYPPVAPSIGAPMYEQTIKSAVALPWPATLAPGANRVTGLAWSPNGTIARVDVSLDGGRTFQPAELIEPNIERAGVRWAFSFEAVPGELTITPRATDDTGVVQPTDLSGQDWNEQGYLFGTAVPHPVTVAGARP